MPKRLNEDVLVLGDIALTTSDAFTSKAIRMRTRSSISHAMLYVTHSSIVHAVTDGVRAENTQGMFFEDDTPVHVLRFKGGLPPKQAQAICDYVRKYAGTEYAWLEAARSPSGRGPAPSKKQFCSRLVAKAYEASGYKLVDNADYCTPDALLTSNALEKVANGTKTISDTEFGYWQSGELTTVDRYSGALDTILKAVRKIDRSVQSFQDIGKFVIAHPEHDEMAANLLRESGYLDWQADVNENPWRYDIGSIGGKKGIEYYCLSTMKSEPRDENRFTKTLDGLRADYERWPRQYLSLLIELYERLVKLHAQRIDAAAYWLAMNGYNQPSTDEA